MTFFKELKNKSDNMLECLLKGFKVFANKKTIAIVILFLISFLGLNYLVNYIIDTFTFSETIVSLPMYIIGYYGISLLWLILGLFAVFFVSNYVSYLIAHLVFKSKRKPLDDLTKVLGYTFFMSIIFSFMYFIMYLLLLSPGIISIILMIIFAIITIVITLIAGLAILLLPVSKTLKESFDRAWLFLKKKFWLLVALMILLGIITLIISFILEYASILWLSNSAYAELILQSVAGTIITMYSIAVIACFIKKK